MAAQYYLVVVPGGLSRYMLLSIVEISKSRARLLQELSGAVKFEKPTIFHHRNLVKIDNSIQSVCDNNDSTTLQFVSYKLLNGLVGDTVEAVRKKSDQLTFATGSADDKPASWLVHYDNWTLP